MPSLGVRSPCFRQTNQFETMGELKSYGVLVPSLLRAPSFLGEPPPAVLLSPLEISQPALLVFLHLKFWQDWLVGAQPPAQEMTLPLTRSSLMHIIRPLHLMLFLCMLVFFSYRFRSINGSSGSGRMISVNELPVSGRAMPLGRRPSTNRSTISNFDSGNESRSTTTSTVAAGRIKSVTNAEFAERPPQAYSRFDPLQCGLMSAQFFCSDLGYPKLAWFYQKNEWASREKLYHVNRCNVV